MNKPFKYFLLGLVLAGTVFLAVHFWPRDPGGILNRATYKLATAESFKYKANIQMTPSENPELGSLDLEIDGMTKNENPPDFIYQGKILAESRMPGVLLTGEGEMITTQDETYYKIEQLPALFSDTEKIEGQWIKMPVSIIGIGEKGEGRELTRKKKKTIKKALEEIEIVQDIEKVDSERVNGKRTTHFKTKFNKIGYVNFIKELNKIILEKEIEDRRYAPLKNLLEGLNDVEIDFWVGKWSGRIYKIAVPGIKSKSAPMQGEINLEILLSDYNKKVNIEIPGDAIPAPGFDQAP